MPMSLVEAAEHIQQFEQNSLRQRIARLEDDLRGAGRESCVTLYPSAGINPKLFTAAQSLKALAGQINVIVHVSGILMALPYILEPDEIIEDLSLGAGNTGVPFDLITNRRVAEFKFTQWRGGPESIRQAEFFKDFYLLAEADTTKDRYLYVVGAHHPVKFLRSRRSLASILSRSTKLAADIHIRYGDRFATIGEYYAFRQTSVAIVDLAEVAPHFASSLDGIDFADNVASMELLTEAEVPANWQERLRAGHALIESERGTEPLPSATEIFESARAARAEELDAVEPVDNAAPPH